MQPMQRQTVINEDKVMVVVMVVVVMVVVIVMDGVEEVHLNEVGERIAKEKMTHLPLLCLLLGVVNHHYTKEEDPTVWKIKTMKAMKVVMTKEMEEVAVVAVEEVEGVVEVMEVVGVVEVVGK